MQRGKDCSIRSRVYSSPSLGGIAYGVLVVQDRDLMKRLRKPAQLGLRVRVPPSLELERNDEDGVAPR